MKKILVIDDEEHIRQLYHDELADSGYHVTTASDGDEAIRKLKEDRPDLITLDIRLGNGPNGIDVLRIIKELDSTIPVIINTAYSEYKQNFGAWASEDYVVKSSELEELMTRIASLLDAG
jgi:DNA-binding response OmpR family regulator